MKVVLDLSELVESGAISPEEAARLKALAAFTAQGLAVNLLVGFGLVAVVASIGVIIPSAFTAIVLGILGLAGGLAVTHSRWTEGELLGHLCAVIGVLTLCGGLALLDDGSLRAVLVCVAILLVTGMLVRSGLLVTIAVLGIGACLGSSTDYHHALYSLSVEEPALTVLVFSAVALAAYAMSLRLRATYERLALIGARVAVLSVNFGFWVGSLWGDDLSRLRHWLGDSDMAAVAGRHTAIPPGAFGIVWAVALAGAAAWGLRANRRWVVNTAAVFGAIHFYTQWFETLGAEPLAVLLAGLTMLGFALGLWRLNRRRPALT